MPIFGYFVVVGTILFGGLVLVSSQLESKPLPVSQTIGIPAPFKASLDADGLPSSANAAAE
jgi:hypothetical protein